MKERMFMVLWGLTLFSIGFATFLMFKMIGVVEANHVLLEHIAQFHVVGK